ncbi:MAG: hypothetical protein VX000_08265, partial [Myxococcota bacterium]|nr:hypothetical protein [Myxococcota bacterium]
MPAFSPWTPAFFLSFFTTGCASYDFGSTDSATARMAADTSGSDGAWSDGGSDGGGGEPGESWDTGDYDDGYDREEEQAVEPLRPAASEDHLFIANPDRATLTRITVDGLGVVTTPVGRDPSVVRVTPDGRRVLVLNRGDDTVSLVDAQTLETRHLPLRPRMNRLEVSPDGRWSISWHDVAYDAAAPERDHGGTASYNEISLIDIDQGSHVPQVVGFHPRDVSFS